MDIILEFTVPVVACAGTTWGISRPEWEWLKGRLAAVSSLSLSFKPIATSCHQPVASPCWQNPETHEESQEKIIRFLSAVQSQQHHPLRMGCHIVSLSAGLWHPLLRIPYAAADGRQASSVSMWRWRWLQFHIGKTVATPRPVNLT